MNSKLAQTIEGLIAQVLPNYEVYTEHGVKMYNKQLFFDFCIPTLRIMIEVQGQQHYNFVEFFHGMIDNFHKSVARDNLKQEWCALNGYTLVYFDCAEIPKLTAEEFKYRIINS